MAGRAGQENKLHGVCVMQRRHEAQDLGNSVGLTRWLSGEKYLSLLERTELLFLALMAH